jgi:hypothetical protein
VRSFAVVLLRRVAFKTFKNEDEQKSIWSAVSGTTQGQVRAALLEGYEKESVVAVRNKVCDTIADVARDDEEQSSMSFDGSNIEPWNELLNVLFQSTKSPEAAHRESAFRVFAALPTLVEDEHAAVLKGVFLEGLQDHAPQVPASLA